MRRHLITLFAAVVGFAAGFVVAHRPEKPARPVGPVDWRGEIGVRRGIEPAARLKAHVVRIDGHTVFNESQAGGRPVTLLTLDGGRVLIGATEIE